MHLRILPPRQRHRQSFVNAAMRRAQLRIDEMAQRVDLGADLRVTIERIDGCQRQQHEGVVVGIAQRIQHRAVRLQRVDKARFAVGGFRLAQQMLQPLQRDRAAVGIPAHLRRLGVAIDLARLHEHPPRRRGIGAAVADRAGRQSRPLCRPSLRSTTAAGSGRSCEASASRRYRPNPAHLPPQRYVVSAIAFPGTSPTPVAAV